MKNHAYSLLKAFRLYNNGDAVQGVRSYMFMMADPFGPWKDTKWDRNYRWDDTNNWNAGTINQIKTEFGFDPTNQDFNKNSGIYFVDAEDFKICFANYGTAVNRNAEGYSIDWYDFDNDWLWGSEKEVTVQVPANNGDLYFDVESYYYHMVPTACFWTDK